MPRTVLGKRTRSSEEVADTTNVLTRSKRRIVISESNDENQNPFRHDREDGSCGVEVDEPALSAKETRSKVASRTVPAKHGASERRVALSPSKISSHFKVAKTSLRVFEDGKNGQTRCPSTPRHRDAASKKVPITPRHRVLLAGSQLTPRTPKTPITPSQPDTSTYQKARQLFSRSSGSGGLVGRDGEKAELSTFLNTRLVSKSGGCLYVSGPPGTGKSAFVDEVSQQYRDADNVKLCVINCMSVKSTKDLSLKLSEDLGLEEDDGFDYLKSCFVCGKAGSTFRYIVVLDEIDRLVDLDLALLYSLFEWSMQASSRLTLIGIANALDLTDRFLPRLKSLRLTPELLPFMPYTASQIADVLTTKLKSLCTEDIPGVPFLHPAAIQFCAKKVASQTGDLRKAFDICRRAIDLVEKETKARDADLAVQDSPSKIPLMENVNLSSPPTPRSPSKSYTKAKPAYTLETAPKITIAHIAKVTAQVFGNGTTQRLGALNLQQKAVLCALSALEKRKRDTQVERTMFATPSKQTSTAPSVKQLFEAYSNLCKQDKLLHPLTSIEFRDVVSGLETLSLVSGVDGKNGSFAMPITPTRTPSRKGRGGFGMAMAGDDRRVASVVGQKELLSALEGAGGELLRDILDGDVLL